MAIWAVSAQRSTNGKYPLRLIIVDADAQSLVFNSQGVRLRTVPLSTEIEVRYSQSMPISNSADGLLQPYRIVCYYYAVEAWYRAGGGMFVPEDIDPYLCTHIHYAYATINPETLLPEPGDKWAEIDNKFYQVSIW